MICVVVMIYVLFYIYDSLHSLLSFIQATLNQISLYPDPSSKLVTNTNTIHSVHSNNRPLKTRLLAVRPIFPRCQQKGRRAPKEHHNVMRLPRQLFRSHQPCTADNPRLKTSPKSLPASHMDLHHLKFWGTRSRDTATELAKLHIKKHLLFHFQIQRRPEGL